MDQTNQSPVKNELDNSDGSEKDIAVLQELDEEKVIDEMFIKNNGNKHHVIEKRQRSTGYKDRTEHHMDQDQVSRGGKDLCIESANRRRHEIGYRCCHKYRTHRELSCVHYCIHKSMHHHVQKSLTMHTCFQHS